MELKLTLNGRAVAASVEADTLLIDFLRAQGCLSKGNRHIQADVGSLTAEQLMGTHHDADVQVAIGAAVCSGFALAALGQHDGVIHTGGHLQVQCTLDAVTARAAAAGAVKMNVPQAAFGGAHQKEERCVPQKEKGKSVEDHRKIDAEYNEKRGVFS